MFTKQFYTHLSVNFGTLIYHSSTATISNDNNDFLLLYDILPFAMCLCIHSFIVVKSDIKCTILTIFKCLIQWHWVHLLYCAITVTTVLFQNFFITSNRKYKLHTTFSLYKCVSSRHFV